MQTFWSVQYPPLYPCRLHQTSHNLSEPTKSQRKPPSVNPKRESLLRFYVWIWRKVNWLSVNVISNSIFSPTGAALTCDGAGDAIQTAKTNAIKLTNIWKFFIVDRFSGFYEQTAKENVWFVDYYSYRWKSQMGTCSYEH